MVWIYVLLVVLAGTLIPLQAGINATLRLSAGHPVLAAITNFSVGWAVLVSYALATRVTLPSAAQLSKAPWWSWIGGMMGACLVLAGVTLSHRLGAATFVALIIVGQLSSSVLLDHFGLVGFEQHSANPMRLLGVALLGLGAYLIRTH